MADSRSRFAAHALAAFSALGVAACAAPAAPARPVAPAAATAPVAPAPTAPAAPGPLLWRIDGAAGPSFLFGTLHAGVRPDPDVAPAVWDALAASDAFVMEADLAAATPAAVQERGALPPGPRLDAQLGKRDFARLTELLGRGVPPRTLKSLRPWMVYSLIVQLSHPTPEPIDLALEARAKDLGKPTSYLEAWTYQVDVLAETMGVDDLRELLADPAAARAKVDALVAAYRAGDVDATAALALDPADRAAHPDRIRRMFDERNAAWVDRLAPRLATERLFIAVGVGHVVGEAGLVALLRAKGLEVERVH